jgi:hypothetical protein
MMAWQFWYRLTHLDHSSGPSGGHVLLEGMSYVCIIGEDWLRRTSSTTSHMKTSFPTRESYGWNFTLLRFAEEYSDIDNLDQLHTGCHSSSALLPTRTSTPGPTNVDHSYKFVIDTFSVMVVILAWAIVGILGESWPSPIIAPARYVLAYLSGL